jgi:hypothetical protein
VRAKSPLSQQRGNIRFERALWHMQQPFRHPCRGALRIDNAYPGVLPPATFHQPSGLLIVASHFMFDGALEASQRSRFRGNKSMCRRDLLLRKGRDSSDSML